MMMYKSLGNIATYINGYPFKPEDRGKTGLPIIRIQDLTGNAYDIGFYDGEYPSRIEINDGDILISWSASLGVYVWNRGRALLNQHIFKVVFDKAEVDKQYFVYAVQYKLKEMEAKTHGATMKHIIKKDFDNTLIPFPDVCEQTRIADKLSCVEKVIAKRKEQLKNLDELTKARFAELFGDTKSNDKGWNTLPLFKILEKGSSVSYGIVQTGDNVEDGVPVFRPIDIAGGHLPHINELKRTKKEISDKYKRTLLNGYELLITVRGSVGETFQVNDEYKGCNVGRNIVPLRFNTDIVLYKYMEQYFAQSGTKDILVTMTKGIALQGLNMSEFREIAVIVPPIDLQKKFVEFANIIDKSKAVVQKSLDETQVLFDSLMQKYFG